MTTPPENSLIALAKASIEPMSCQTRTKSVAGMRRPCSHTHQVIRRLIEQKDIRALERERCKHDSITKTVGQVTDRRGLVRSRDTESAESGTPELNVGFRVLRLVRPLEVLKRCGVEVELVSRMLGVFAKLQRWVTLDRALSRLESASDQVEQSRLSSSVLSNDGDTRVHAVRSRYDQ